MERMSYVPSSLGWNLARSARKACHIGLLKAHTPRPNPKYRELCKKLGARLSPEWKDMGFTACVQMSNGAKTLHLWT